MDNWLQKYPDKTVYMYKQTLGNACIPLNTTSLPFNGFRYLRNRCLFLADIVLDVPTAERANKVVFDVHTISKHILKPGLHVDVKRLSIDPLHQSAYGVASAANPEFVGQEPFVLNCVVDVPKLNTWLQPGQGSSHTLA